MASITRRRTGERKATGHVTASLRIAATPVIAFMIVLSLIAGACTSSSNEEGEAASDRPIQAVVETVVADQSAEPPTNDLRRVELVNFESNPEFAERTIWALRYMKSAAKTSLFRRVLRSAIDRDTPLHMFHEFLRTGPYVPCAAPVGSSLRDPNFVFSNRSFAYEAVLAIANSNNELQVWYDPSVNGTAEAGTDHGYGHNMTTVVRLGGRMFSAWPNHLDFGWRDARFGELGPSYPVHEMAGIILHEILHTHGFEHGTASANECGYASYECVGAHVGICRKNSLPEVAEAVMTEVVGHSTGWCADEGVTAVGGHDDLWQPPSANPGLVAINSRVERGPASSAGQNCFLESYLG